MSTEELYEIYQSHPEVVIDSRKVTEGCLFFAIRGERFDGNTFAEKALESGAAYAVIDNADLKKDDRFILVEDTLKTLQELAREHRRRFSIPVIAITGSNGKTTTKELLSSVLAGQYPTHFTKGNFNNHIGVPLTLLAMPQGTEVAVIEMGANHVGEIDFLCRIAEPTHGIITNIGRAHLEGFGGIEGVKKGKSELYRYLQEKPGMIFVNKDEPFLEELAAKNSPKLLYLRSERSNLDVEPYETILLSDKPFLKISFRGYDSEMVEIQSQLIGEYNFNNIMTAVSIGRYFKVPIAVMKNAIENYVPSNNRSQLVQKDSNTYILDAYNANPTSMRHALTNFSKMEANQRIAIIGSMLELGEYTEAEHEEIAAYAESLSFDQVVLVGKEFESAAVKNDLPHFENTEQLKSWLAAKDFENTHLLLKGSRGIGLEKVLG